MSTVNIIMATYNGERYLKEQIDSILNSTYTDWNLLICDDGSTDGTLDIITDYVLRYSDRIFLYRNPRRLNSVQNFLQGLQLMNRQSDKQDNSAMKEWTRSSSNQTGYFMFCDQDDVWMPDKIERTLHCAKELERKYGKDSPILVYTDAIVVDENLNSIHDSFYRYNRLNQQKSDLPHMLMENKCIGCTIMINRALADYVKILPKMARYHDWWLAILAVSFGHIAYLPKPTMRYRQHDSNVVGSKSFSNYIVSRVSDRKKQKGSLLDTQRQAEEFLELYEQELDEKQKFLIKNFAFLHKKGWLKRRYIVLRYRFLKTGLIRNLGIFFMV